MNCCMYLMYLGCSWNDSDLENLRGAWDYCSVLACYVNCFEFPLWEKKMILLGIFMIFIWETCLEF